jgi:adenosylcobinamide-phosphate synthase
MTLWTLSLACWIALLVDHYLGELALRCHPVVWIGHYLGWSGDWVQRHADQSPEHRDLRAFWLAALCWLAGAVLVTGLAWLLQTALVQMLMALVAGRSSGAPGDWATWLGAIAMGLLLKPLLAWAMLKTEVCAVEAALAESLQAGRARLAWLVSRDVTLLTPTQVRESAIETLAENLNDSVVAPLFWFVLLGLPGAALYRFANTADAMWGYPGLYKGRNWAWAGKWAARADDALSWLPARITALCLLLAGLFKGRRELQLARHLRHLHQLPGEAACTPSPNSGWPMAAMALVLGVGLCKPGVYVLNAQGGEVQAADTRQAISIGNRALLLFVGLGCGGLLWLKECLFAWLELLRLFAAAGVQQ